MAAVSPADSPDTSISLDLSDAGKRYLEFEVAKLFRRWQLPHIDSVCIATSSQAQHSRRQLRKRSSLVAKVLGDSASITSVTASTIFGRVAPGSDLCDVLVSSAIASSGTYEELVHSVLVVSLSLFCNPDW